MRPIYTFVPAMVVLAAIAPLTEAAEIRLHREHVCQRPLITLGDIADVLGADTTTEAALAAVELVPAPSAGRSRMVRARQLYDLLARRGVQMNQHRLSGASSVQLRGPSAVKRVSAQRTAPALRPVPPQRASAKPAPVQVVVAVRPLRRDEVIRAGDVELRDAGTPSAAQRGAARIEDVVGKQLARSVGTGQPLRLNELTSIRLVRRNEVVSVLARARGIQIRTSARATEDGGRDDLIVLQSLLDPKERFTARVVGHKSVEIYTASVAREAR